MSEGEGGQELAEGDLTLRKLMRFAVEQGASDLHLKIGRPPALRLGGEIRFLNLPPFDDEEVHTLAMACMTPRQQEQYLAEGTLDFAYMIEGGDRFRLNVFRQRGCTSVAARRVNRNIPTFDELNLPESVLTKVCDSMQGLVLFAGITGCGKSTSIAACLGHINARRKCHIVTIEDPIEFLFEDDKSFINQREVGTDVRDFESAMRTLLREDPDVVLIGEMRDRETFETVLRVAETGHLVFATIHASSASGVITRILDLFPSEEHALIRQSLASNLVAIVCQKLVPSVRKDVERVPATEVLLQDVVVRKMIVQGQESRLADVLAGGNIDGSHNFTISFRELVARDWVTRRVAMQYAPDPDALRMALKGISIKTSTLD